MNSFIYRTGRKRKFKYSFILHMQYAKRHTTRSLVTTVKENRKLVWSEICALLGYYAAYSGNSVPTLRDNLLVRSSRF